MMELIEAIDHHRDNEGVEVEVHAPGGWDDIRRLIEPLAKAWKEIGDLCNTDALDGDEQARQELGGGAFVAGRSSMAHSVLRIMARAEAEVQDR